MIGHLNFEHKGKRYDLTEEDVKFMIDKLEVIENSIQHYKKLLHHIESKWEPVKNDES